MLPMFLLTVAFAKDDSANDKWDVNAPPGEKGFVQIDVEQGTWMSLDVSPDGKTIVFDLLGDVYSIPVGGGTATSLTSGMAWDMQPRFSPDGREIVFTSDRGGGDNLWRMSFDGSDPTPITKESFRLFNSPDWSPDGEYVVGRKHYTAGRSLGAGELWLVHRSGGAGLQLTKRTNDQLDLGEPAFSPDGRYVYYSRDKSGGSHFRYNKDPNKSIYGIERLDRQTGDIESITGGSGGAIRPTPSPDGTHLVFLRRNRGKTVMMIRELNSGLERELTDIMDHDMAETWAIHGVYPGMSWTPDSQSVIFWAKGGIHRIALSSGKIEKIPFRVVDKREIRKALKRKTKVAPPEFEVKLLRGVSVSPDGSKVAYSALGKVYVKALPNGEPKRLTSQDSEFEFDPSWSSDSKTILFATWNDQRLGSIKSAPSGCLGWSKTLKLPKGHYREPSFSSDGRRVVYRKVGGGWLRSPLWSQSQGIYVSDSQGGNPIRIVNSGHRPVFSSSGEAILFQAYRKGDLTLNRVDIASRKERVLARSKKAIEISLSPTGGTIAFVEKHQVHLLSLPSTGRTPVIGPNFKAMPYKTLSLNAGKNIHFSKGGKRVHWSLGSALFSTDIDAKLGVNEKEESVITTDIGFRAKTDLGMGTVAIVGAQVVTMDKQGVIKDGTVLWTNGRIVSVGPRNQVQIPSDAFVLDGKGMTVLPGYIDVHHHGSQSDQGIIPQQNWKNLSSLAFGVTTVHDPSHDTEMIFSAAELQRAGMVLGPRIYSTGTILYGADSRSRAHVDSLADALKHLQRMKSQGATTVKSYNQPRRDQRQQVVEAGRQTDVMVLPEGASLMMHNLTQIIDGHTGIEHAIPVAPLYEDILQLWSGTEVAYTPTLGVAYGGLMGEHYWYANTNVWENERLLAFAPRRVIDAASRRPMKAPLNEYSHIVVAKSVKALQDRGVPVQVGAHGQREGLAAHWEMRMFEQGGMSQLNALKAATLDGARYIGLDEDIGSITVGKLADLAIVAGDPLTDLSKAEAVKWTVLGGKVYDSMSLKQLFPKSIELAPLFFQGDAPSQPTSLETSGCGCAHP